MKTIHNAHMKEFETVYNKDMSIKWINVTLQVLAKTDREYHKICEELTEHMDKPHPRYVQFKEQ